jgi:DNA-binding GntR family transcriptional regulator
MRVQTLHPNDGHASHAVNHVNIRDDVYELLRRRILSHEYPPGHRFDLNDLSTQLGISHTPLKEAFHRLSTEGLVNILPRRGTFVTTVDPREIDESYGVRLALERYAAALVVREVTPKDLACLRGILGEMRQLLDAEDYQAVVQKYIVLDHEFHVGIIALAQNRRLVEIYRTVGAPLQMARVLSKFTAADSKKYTEPEHKSIMQALERREAKALAQAMTEHIERAKVRILNVLNTAKS